MDITEVVKRNLAPSFFTGVLVGPLIYLAAVQSCRPSKWIPMAHTKSTFCSLHQPLTEKNYMNGVFYMLVYVPAVGGLYMLRKIVRKSKLFKKDENLLSSL